MDIRYIAKIVIEAETPLSIGSGQKGLLIDRVVAKDANNLPYIPGTSLCGVLRHTFDNAENSLTNDWFGYGGDEGTGSRIKISSAHLIGENGTEVIEGLKNIDFESESYYKHFDFLPERDHVCMTDKGVAKKHGKFDEELVHKGTRFAFEIELLGNDADATHWQNLLNLFANPIFRIGSGTRKGFGKIKVIKNLSVSKVFDLNKKEDLFSYLNKSSSLNGNYNGWTTLELVESDSLANWAKFSLNLTAKDFFLFSAGFGDADADAKPKTEQFFEWTTGKPVLKTDKYLLIPATSIKGAIAHRVAYHYNKLQNVFIGTPSVLKASLDVETAISAFNFKIDFENLDMHSDSENWKTLEEQIKSFSYDSSSHWKDFEENLTEEVYLLKSDNLPIGENNDAVKALFGFAKNDDEGQRGKVILNDVYLPYQSDKVFNHVKIDRFTSGTIDGALFQEKAAAYSKEFTLDIWIDNTAFEGNNGNFIRDAFIKTLNELVEGQLQLGGNTTKGHGLFTGSFTTNA